MFSELQPPKPFPSPNPLYTIGKIIRIVFTLIGVGAMFLFISLFVYINACLAWIAYWPVPDVPHKEVEYAIRDVGPVGTVYDNEFREDYQAVGCVLTEKGEVQHLSVEQIRHRLGLEKLQNERWLAENPGASKGNPLRVLANHSDGMTLVRQDHGWYLWREGKRDATIPYQIHGYEWKPLIKGFHRLNGSGVTIGNGRIATAYASSGGTSSPHGRDMALVWRPDRQQTEDINSRIDASSGWYVTRAVDINVCGQILCIGHKTDARGAETKSNREGRLLILTPTYDRSVQ